MHQHTTKTGRALPIGRVTRKSREVGRPKGVKPLPLHLQCHPQYAHKLPRHPDCDTSPDIGPGMLALIPCASILHAVGHLLSKEPGPIHVEVVGHGTWYADDSAFAFRWALAARAAGLTVNVYINPEWRGKR